MATEGSARSGVGVAAHRSGMTAAIRRVLVVLMVAAGLTGTLRPLSANEEDPCPPGPVPVGGEKSPPVLEWHRPTQERPVAFTSVRTGALLCATLFAPDPLSSTEAPAVVIVPGGDNGRREYYAWAARDLAGHGYVVVTVDPQGQGESEPLSDADCLAATPEDPVDDDGYPEMCDRLLPFESVDGKVDAYRSAIDYLQSGPFAHLVDKERIGVAGHSQAARAASYVQGIDDGVAAIVAWDNLASDASGDAGSAGGGTAFGSRTGWPRAVTPRVPAMGQASDKGGLTDLEGGPESKKTAYNVWREAGVPVAQLLFRDVPHSGWTQTEGRVGEATPSDQLRTAAYYTRMWFDQHLRQRPDAPASLLATTVAGRSRADILSGSFTSAAAFGALDCPDLSACVDPVLRLDVPSRARSGQTVVVTGSLHLPDLRPVTNAVISVIVGGDVVDAVTDDRGTFRARIRASGDGMTAVTGTFAGQGNVLAAMHTELIRTVSG